MLKDDPPGKIAPAISQPEVLVRGWLEVWQALSSEPAARKVIERDTLWPWEARDSFGTRSGFMKLLGERHGYSPASADEFCEWLRRYAGGFRATPGQAARWST